MINMIGPKHKDFEVCQMPSDAISGLEFSPMINKKNLLCASSWDQSVRVWEVKNDGRTKLKMVRNLNAPPLDVSWSDDNSKIFLASSDKEALLWDLQADQMMQVGSHEAGVKTCHWINAPNYSCLMTGSWDKTLKFWDTRSPNPMLTLSLPERCFASDVIYPMAVVATACRSIIAYSLEKGPVEFKRVDCLLNQLRALAIFKDKKAQPVGVAIGSTCGQVAIQYMNDDCSENYIFRCHRTVSSSGIHNIYVVNDVKVHPVHNTLATAGSDGAYCYWDINSHAIMPIIKGKPFNQPLTKCCFNADGQIFAYALGYDWSKGYEFNDPDKQPQLFLHPCYVEMQPDY